MITRVRKLTKDNVRSLQAVKLGSVFGVTFADFRGSPAQALREVEQAMSQMAGRSVHYRSLCAVRRKLRTAAAVEIGPEGPHEEALTDYVTVTRTVQGETAAAYS